MSDERSRTIRVVEDLVARYNAKDIDGILDLYAEEASYWSAIGDWRHGREAIRAHLEELHRTLPDEQMRVVALVADGSVAVVEFSSRGTSPTGAAYEIDFTEVIETEAGRIHRVLVYLDPEEVTAITG